MAAPVKRPDWVHDYTFIVVDKETGEQCGSISVTATCAKVAERKAWHKILTNANIRLELFHTGSILPEGFKALTER